MMPIYKKVKSKLLKKRSYFEKEDEEVSEFDLLEFDEKHIAKKQKYCSEIEKQLKIETKTAK